MRIYQKFGSGEAGAFLAKVPEQGEQARQLAYVLYTICERKGLADDARAYNELAIGWGGVVETSVKVAETKPTQGLLEI